MAYKIALYRRLAAFAALVVGFPAPAGAEAVIVDLGALARTFSMATDLNDAPQVVGSMSDGSFNDVQYPFIWEGSGAVTELPAYGSSRPLAVNSNGVAVGWAADGTAIAVWSDGQLRLLDRFAPNVGMGGRAVDVNDSDEAAGWGMIGSSGFFEGMVWRNITSDDYETVRLDRLHEDTGCTVSGMNNNSQVVGMCFDAPGQLLAVRWDGTALTPLPPLPGHRESRVYAINNAGVAVGISCLDVGCGSGINEGVRWVGATPEALGGFAADINSRGDILGVAEIDPASAGPEYVVWTADGIVNLSAQIPPDTEISVISLGDINDQGQMAGIGVIEGETHGIFFVPDQPAVPPSVRLELVQAVDHGRDLVAEKNLTVRAFITLPERFPLSGFSAVADLDIDGVPSVASDAGIIYPPEREFSLDERRNAVDSLNLTIRAEDANALLNSPGEHTFRVTVQPFGNPTSDPFASTSQDIRATFRKSKRGAVVVYPAGLENEAGDEIYPDTDFVGSAPGAPVVKQPNIANSLKTLFPMDEEQILQIRRPALFSNFQPTNKLLAEIALLSFKDRVFHDEAIGAALAGDPDLDPDLVWPILVYPAKVDGASPMGDRAAGMAWIGVIMLLDSSETAVAHEIGHLLGLGDEYCLAEFPCSGRVEYPNNPPPANEDEGDGAGRYILPEMRAFDNERHRAPISLLGDGNQRGMMGSVGERWITRLNYDLLYDELVVPLAGESPRRATAKERTSSDATPREVVLLSGLMGRDDSVDLRPLSVLTTPVDFPRPDGETYAAEFRSAAGTLLDRVQFDVQFELERYGDPPEVVLLDPAPFAITVDLPPGTASIVVLRDAQVLKEVQRSATPPSVEITSFTISDDLLGLEWAGNDPDGDNLAYSVFYSADGTQLDVLDVNIGETSTSIRRGQVGKPENGGFVRVRASDGFNFSEATETFAFGDVTMVRYGHQGPNLAGMCSQRGCVREKRHTLVGRNQGTDPTELGLLLDVLAVPDSACTVNGVGAGESIPVASAMPIDPGASVKGQVALVFACTPESEVFIGGNYVLRGRAISPSAFELTPGDDAIEIIQTVK